MSTFNVSLTFAGASNPLVILRSLAMTIPSLAKIPTQVPALLMASIAYSTYVINQRTTVRRLWGDVLYLGYHLIWERLPSLSPYLVEPSLRGKGRCWRIVTSCHCTRRSWERLEFRFESVVGSGCNSRWRSQQIASSGTSLLAMLIDAADERKRSMPKDFLFRGVSKSQMCSPDKSPNILSPQHAAWCLTKSNQPRPCD